MALPPNTDLVAVGWGRLALPGVGIATALPTDLAALRDVGFVRMFTVGGSPNRDVPMRAPVVAAECWAAPAPGSSKVPWDRANVLAEQLLAATYDEALMGRVVPLPTSGDYSPARVHTVVALSEPRRIENDPGNFARFDVDLLFSWTAA